MKIIGGPLDGAVYNAKVSLDESFIILECSTDQKQVQLYACYQFDGEKLNFVNAKTSDQMIALRKEVAHESRN